MYIVVCMSRCMYVNGYAYDLQVFSCPRSLKTLHCDICRSCHITYEYKYMTGFVSVPCIINMTITVIDSKNITIRLCDEYECYFFIPRHTNLVVVVRSVLQDCYTRNELMNFSNASAWQPVYQYTLYKTLSYSLI